jgi:hypothetical protein
MKKNRITIAKKEVFLAILFTVYTIIAMYGKDFSQKLSNAFSGNPNVIPYDIWSVLVLIVFLLSSVYVRLTINDSTSENRAQLITFLSSLALVIGIALNSSRGITLYFAGTVYFFFFLPIVTYSLPPSIDVKSQEEKNKISKIVFSFLAFCVVASIFSAVLGFVLQIVSLQALKDMRAFGLTPVAIAVITYEILIANGHILTGSDLTIPNKFKNYWKKIVYTAASCYNGLYGFFWLSGSISGKAFSEAVSAIIPTSAGIVVKLVSFFIVAAYTFSLFMVYELIRARLPLGEKKELLTKKLIAKDFVLFFAVGMTFGMLLALLSFSGLALSFGEEKEQLFRQINLVWVHALTSTLLIPSLWMAQNLKNKFLYLGTAKK